MHYIVARGYDENGYIYANDPNNKTMPRKQHQDKFSTCLKQAFIFWPKVSVNKPDETKGEQVVVNEPAKNQENVASGATGTNIIDISKWQGNIDFSKTKKDVALIIARASCGSDKDVKFDEYAKAMNEQGIPFGVYCFSYAGTVAKAQDEAQKIVKYASAYNPLFYVMDAEEEKITTEAIKAFANELRKQGAKKIGCYVANHRYKEYNYDS